jgi:hypothetical protein
MKKDITKLYRDFCENKGKSKEWYWDTLGVDVDLVERIIASRKENS